MAALYRADENACVGQMLCNANPPPSARQAIADRAAKWIEAIRTTPRRAAATELLTRFGLSTQEGLALMCLAEALLRIPDRATADALIKDKLDPETWDAAFSQDASWTVRGAQWALLVSGKIAHPGPATTAGGALARLLSRLGRPMVREALRVAMGWMAAHFVTGETIDDALRRTEPDMAAGVRFSFDMLGEAARTAADADRFMREYEAAIDAIGDHYAARGFARPSGISVKLSALHPRYEWAQRTRVMGELAPRLVSLCERAAKYNLPLTVDAEEGERLQLSVELAAAAMSSMQVGDWSGLGFAVQAYDKRARAAIDAFAALAAAHDRRIHLRLVKGAYWDGEIKRAQERGLPDFNVYTRKENTDISYYACARRILDHRAWVDPYFATHNALTASFVAELAGDAPVEFQRLHGMGEELHQVLRAEGRLSCVYAPVGRHDVLLGYLVRRLLENGANSSFVHRLNDPTVPVADLTADPVQTCLARDDARHPSIKLPAALFAPERRNSAGVDLADPYVAEPLLAEVETYRFVAPRSQPFDADALFARGARAFAGWNGATPGHRAACLERLADRLESERGPLMSILVREGGKCLPDALAEVREAVDFCRYYALRARHDFAPLDLPGPTGEHNRLTLRGRGVFLCISPWNFPLAIFLGQVAAALVAGNAVIAKPAPQTPHIAQFVAGLFAECGLPEDVLQIVPGGPDVGAALVAHADVAGVAFTGSTATAQAINRALAAKDGPIVPLIAETGGQNAMIVDSTALPEQVVDDVVTSAFRSAGQRCSALRLLALPERTADAVLTMLAGAMRELTIGDPGKLSTDIGPVIDAAAKERLNRHIDRLRAEARAIYDWPLTEKLAHGNYVAPQAWEIPDVAFLKGEVFGPILHVIRYEPEQLPALIAAINATGYALTAGVHSRVQAFADTVGAQLRAGNLYVNRSMIGAVVGSQPFGGMGLSGTGPKAGGPHYLPRFAVEHACSVNTTAAGGNASLLVLASEN